MNSCIDVVGKILGGSIKYSWTKRKTWAQGSEAVVKRTVTTAYSFISGWDADQEIKFNNHRVVLGTFWPKKETCFHDTVWITVNDSIVLYYLFLFLRLFCKSRVFLNKFTWIWPYFENIGGFYSTAIKIPKCVNVCLALKTNLLCIAVTLEILIMFRLIGCCHYWCRVSKAGWYRLSSIHPSSVLRETRQTGVGTGSTLVPTRNLLAVRQQSYNLTFF